MFISDTPMTRITVPVTTGGNSRASRPINGATMRPKRPLAITAP